MGKNTFESREIELGEDVIARIDWEYDDDGYADLSWMGEFVPRRDEYTIDRVHGIFLGEYVDGFFRMSLSHMGLDGKNGLSMHEWEKVENEALKRITKMKHWVYDDALILDQDYDNPNLAVVEYGGYELLAGELGRTCWDSSRYMAYWKPGDNYCPPKDSDEIGYILEDWKRMERFGDDWWMTGCIVTIEVDEVEVGEASVWGIESDCGDEYRREVEQEELYEALSEASKSVDLYQRVSQKLAALDVDALVELVNE